MAAEHHRRGSACDPSRGAGGGDAGHLALGGQGAAEEHGARKERYAEEPPEIQDKAHELEKGRDAKEAEAEHLMHLHHRFAAGVAFLKVPIALGAVAVLTRRRIGWLLSLAVGAIGMVLLGRDARAACDAI